MNREFLFQKSKQDNKKVIRRLNLGRNIDDDGVWVIRCQERHLGYQPCCELLHLSRGLRSHRGCSNSIRSVFIHFAWLATRDHLVKEFQVRISEPSVRDTVDYEVAR